MSRPSRPLRAVSIAVPVLDAHEAEALIDLIEQVQGALWDAYGEAILQRVADADPPPEEHRGQPPGSDDPSS